MKRRYNDYMQNIYPSDAFLNHLESEINRTLCRPRSAALYTLSAIAAVIAVVITGAFFFRPVIADPENQPLTVTTTATNTAEPENTPAAQPETTVLPLEYIDEVVEKYPTDVNYLYRCILLTDESLTLYDEELTPIKTLVPGDSCFYQPSNEPPTSDGYFRVLYWDAETETAALRWAKEPDKSDLDFPLVPIGDPGKVRENGAVMRLGPSANAPDIGVVLSPGQYIHLIAQDGNWIFATTAPFDQKVENPALPTPGWVYVGDVWGLKYMQDESETEALPVITVENPSEFPTNYLELEMTGDKVFNGLEKAFGAVSIGFENNLVGPTYNTLDVYEKPELNSPIVATLLPGNAFWQTCGGLDTCELTDDDGNVYGSAFSITWLDEETNVLQTGWLHQNYNNSKSSGSAENNIESIQLPGRVRENGTPLRYGRRSDSPALALLDAGTRLGLAYRDGNWIYATTEPFCMGGERPITGWVHVSEVVGMHWREPITHMEITVDNINLRRTPDGELITDYDRSAFSNGLITYGGATVPGKKGDWHYVTLTFAFGQEQPMTGYISADYVQLFTFPLKDELPIEDVVSATLEYKGTDAIEASSQTIEGEKLTAFLNRLGNARSESVYSPVCGEGAATITLCRANGSQTVLPIAADSCTYVRFGDVTYDLKTEQERTEQFLNDGGVSLADILPVYFDQIVFPLM